MTQNGRSLDYTVTGSGIVRHQRGDHLYRGRAFGGMKERGMGREGSKYG